MRAQFFLLKQIDEDLPISPLRIRLPHKEALLTGSACGMCCTGVIVALTITLAVVKHCRHGQGFHVANLKPSFFLLVRYIFVTLYDRFNFLFSSLELQYSMRKTITGLLDFNHYKLALHCIDSKLELRRGFVVLQHSIPCFIC